MSSVRIRCRKAAAVLAAGFALAAVLAPAARAQEEGPWYAHYVRALALIQGGEAVEARAELEKSLALRAEPGLRLQTDGVNYVDYLPHLYLAIAAHMSGDAVAAREHFGKADEAGVAALSEAGRQLLESYRLLLGYTPPEPEGREAPSSHEVDRHDHAARDMHEAVLSDSEFQQVQRTVLGRCGLDPDTAPSDAPWYFHYELGMTLARSGDPQRALSALVEATDQKPAPHYATRIYGMWFVDYLPYFEIAKLHAELGNWNCASDALKVSEQKSELAPDDPRIAEVKTLKDELHNRLIF